MKLRVYHAGDGDCLLLSSDDGKRNMLVDGGRATSFNANTARDLAALREEQRRLNVVCVSHIDDDHITGILRMVQNEVAWRVFEFRQQNNIRPRRRPSIPRPPEIGQIWHNALFRLIGLDLAVEAQSLMASTARLMAGSEDEEVLDLASHIDSLATGERAAMELSRRISAEQLGIPLNQPTGGGLMKRGEPGAFIPFGGMKLFVLGPTEDDFEALRVVWANWIRRNASAIDRLRQRLLTDEENLGVLSPELVANPISAALGDGVASITEPNLAFLTLFIEDGAETLLLTGDADAASIQNGLAHHGKLDANGRIHVSVLKVQHHGAEANVTQEFVDAVTADHYVFCANGNHKNPEVDVIEGFANARLESPDDNRAFKFWFTSHDSRRPRLTASQRSHMRMIRGRLGDLEERSNGRMSSEFLRGRFFDVL